MWTHSSASVIKDLYNDDNYKEWNEAIGAGATEDFSEEMLFLISRLAGILVTELHANPNTKDKIIKILELAAVAGKTL
jgi:hypothetical protein